MTQPVPHGERSSIYARYPLRGGPLCWRCFCNPGSRARLDLPFGEFVQLACIHPAPPKPPWSPAPRPGGAVSCPRCLRPVTVRASSPETSTPPSITRSSAAPAPWLRWTRPAGGNGLSLTWGPRPDRRLTLLLAINHVLHRPALRGPDHVGPLAHRQQPPRALCRAPAPRAAQPTGPGIAEAVGCQQAAIHLLRVSSLAWSGGLPCSSSQARTAVIRGCRECQARPLDGGQAADDRSGTSLVLGGGPRLFS